MMPHNTRLAFGSFKKCSEEEKLVQMEEFLNIISSKVTQISVFLLCSSSYEVIVFHI